MQDDIDSLKLEAKKLGAVKCIVDSFEHVNKCRFLPCGPDIAAHNANTGRKMTNPFSN